MSSVKEKRNLTLQTFCNSHAKGSFLSLVDKGMALPRSFMHRQPKLNIREPLNYKDLYGNKTDLCKMVETNIVLSIKST